MCREKGAAAEPPHVNVALLQALRERGVAVDDRAVRDALACGGGGGGAEQAASLLFDVLEAAVAAAGSVAGFSVDRDVCVLGEFSFDKLAMVRLEVQVDTSG